ncbi:hypothetical protein [Psychroflexus salis]|nr:hypothetical protein [Psychroflexus salis]
METKKENTANRNELAALEKQMRVNNAENIINQRKDFEAYFSGLYDSLNTQYNSEKNHAKSGKIKMLERFINEINEALYKYKNNSNVNVNNEDYKIEALQSLRNNFEKHLTDLHTPDKTQSKGSNKQKPKQLKDFLINANKFNDKEVEKIENSLIKHFQKPIIKAYSKGKKFSKQPFNLLILKLQNNYIDTTKHNKSDVVKYFKKLFFGTEWEQNIDKDTRAYTKAKNEYKSQKELSKRAKSIYNDVIEPNFEAFKSDMMFLNPKFK